MPPARIITLSAPAVPGLSCHGDPPEIVRCMITPTGMRVLPPAPETTWVAGILLAMLHTVLVSSPSMEGYAFTCAGNPGCPAGDRIRIQDETGGTDYVVGAEVCHEHELWEATLLTAEPPAREAHTGPAGITLDCCDRPLADHQTATLRINFQPEAFERGVPTVYLGPPVEIWGYWCGDTFYPLPQPGDDPQQRLLDEIADPAKTRRDVAACYKQVIRSGDMERVDWAVVNQAIVDRWSWSALSWIKRLAWQEIP